MLCPKTVRLAWGAALAAALTCGAAAQTVDFAQRLAQAQHLQVLNRFTEARTVYRALLRDVRQDSPANRQAAVVLDNLGLDEQGRGDYAAAETAFNHGLAAVPEGAADSPVTIALKTHLAELYAAELRPEDAQPLIRQVVAVLRSSPLPDRKALSVAYEDLATVCIMLRKLQEPETLLRQAQALIETELGPSHPRLASSLLTYAGLLTVQHRYAEAVIPAERAWQILRTVSPRMPKPFLASALTVLGAVYLHVGRVAEAESCARQSVDLAEASLGLRHPRLGLYLANYAVILNRAGHKKEAKAIQKRSGEIMAQFPTGNSGGGTVNVAALR